MYIYNINLRIMEVFMIYQYYIGQMKYILNHGISGMFVPAEHNFQALGWMMTAVTVFSRWTYVAFQWRTWWWTLPTFTLVKQCHNSSPKATIFRGAMFTIPKLGWFMALFYPHDCIFSQLWEFGWGWVTYETIIHKPTQNISAGSSFVKLIKCWKSIKK